METAIPALIIIALLLLASVTLADQLLSSHQAAAESWRDMEERELDRSRTEISILDAYASMDTQVLIEVSNDGQTKLADFEQWDVILRKSSTADWYAYGDWTEQIAETVEPGILNPGETMTVRLTVETGVGSDNLVVVTTPNGISASQVFTY
jgi:archaellum component FlaF (FlaF/FlaG flagellin family)